MFMDKHYFKLTVSERSNKFLVWDAWSLALFDPGGEGVRDEVVV